MSRPRRIFVVEDEAVIAMELADRLREMGYEVSVAVRAEAALRQIPAAKPDVILMDVNLGSGMDGIEVSRRIADVCDAPVIFLTAYSDADFTARAIQASGSAFVVKPFQPLALRANIEMTLAKKAAEDALRASEARFRAFFEQAAVGVAELDSTTGRFLAVNRKCCDILGYTEPELLALDFMRITYPDDLATDLEAMERLRNGEVREFSLEKRLLHKSGALCWISLAVSPLWNAGERPSRHLAVVQDITARKKAEEDARRKDAKFHALFTCSPDPVLLVDEKGIITLANPEAERVFGYTREELVGLAVEALMPESVRSGHEGERRRFFDSPTRRNMGARETPLLARRKDGSIFPVEIALSPLSAEDGLRVVAALRDVSTRFAAEEQRRSLETRLRAAQRLEALGTLAGGIAHDFNNLLMVIVSNLQIARHDAAPLLAEPLEAIAMAAERARELVQQVLTFGRRQKMKRTDVSLGPVVEETARLLRSTVPAGVHVEYDIPAGPVCVHGDAGQIHQVLMNLGTNAWHAIAARGRGTIQLRLQSPVEADGSTPAVARILVSDDGTGIDSAVLDRIFEPFFTTKPVGRGSGLGLSLVHGIIEAHGGVIRVESELGKGSTFQVDLPAVSRELSLSARIGQADPSPKTDRRES